MKNRKAPSKFDTLAQAASSMGVSPELLKAAKAAGCPAFTHGRVDGRAFKEWVAKHGDKIGDCAAGSLKDQKLKEEVRKLRIANDLKDKILVAKSEVASAVRRALAQVATLSESKLVNEYPTAVAGLDVPQARVYGKRLHDALMEECQKLAREFPE